jgi:acetylornithine deacetylase/succinyl-diaminopimelate desuccinylase family protein
MTRAFIEARRDELIAFACELVATPSPNPPGNEQAVAALVVDRLRRLGIDDVRTVGREPARANVLARIPGRGGGPSLLLNGHLDTRPPGELAAWSHDPYAPTIAGDELIGLGAVDMKGAVAAIVYAGAAIAAEGAAGDLVLALTADEEAGAGFGARFLVEEGLIAADAAIVAEPAGVTRDWEAIRLVSRGNALFRIRVRGTPFHSSLSDQVPAVSANLMAARLIAQLEAEGPDVFSYEPHPLVPRGPTLNPALWMQGGAGYGVIADQAEILCDVRCLPGMTREGVVADLAAFLARARAVDDRLDADFEVEFWLRPCEIAPDHPIVVALQAASAAVLGEAPPLGAFPGGTDAPFFQLDAGVPTVPAFGPGLLTTAHRPNEYVPVQGIVDAACIYADAARRFLDGEG